MNSETARLHWSAPADDGGGSVSDYDVRYLDATITLGLWESAHPLEGEPTPGSPGEPESLLVIPSPDMRFFAIRSADAAGNVSALSNIAELAAGDTVPPATVQDLTASLIGDREVELTWTAPGDDGSEGTAMEYDMRIVADLPSGYDWEDGSPLQDVPMPGSAGVLETLRVEDLGNGTAYAFAVRTRDEVRWSGWSNVAQIETPDLIPPGTVTNLAAAYAGGHSVTVTWTATGDDDSPRSLSSRHHPYQKCLLRRMSIIMSRS